MEQIQKASHYRSYYESAKKLKDPAERLAFYDAIDAYRFDGIEPENLPFGADLLFTAIRSFIDADVGRKCGGAPTGNKNAKKQPEKQPQNNVQKQPEKQPKTNKEEVEEEVEEEEEEEVDANATEEERLDAESFGDLQTEAFALLSEHNTNRDTPKERKIPVSHDVISFAQKESRDLASLVQKGESPGNVLAGLRNYLALAKNTSVWKTYYSWQDFIKNFVNFSPENFSVERFMNQSKSERAIDKVDRPEDMGKILF